jgi:hypothetical protein
MRRRSRRWRDPESCLETCSFCTVLGVDLEIGLVISFSVLGATVDSDLQRSRLSELCIGDRRSLHRIAPRPWRPQPGLQVDLTVGVHRAIEL